MLKKCANLNIKWRRRQIEKIALGIVSLTLVACAPIYPGPIGYTKADPVWGTKYGYTDKPIGKDEYSVVVTGNPKTSKERVVDIALLRAANIAKEQKRTHFVILNQISEELRTHEMVSAPLGSRCLSLRSHAGQWTNLCPASSLRLLPGGQVERIQRDNRTTNTSS